MTDRQQQWQHRERINPPPQDETHMEMIRQEGKREFVDVLSLSERFHASCSRCLCAREGSITTKSTIEQNDAKS